MTEMTMQRMVPMSTLLSRLWAKVDKDSSPHHYQGSSCWEWRGRVTRDGYGLINITIGKEPGRRRAVVHRLTYAEAFGPIPERMVLDHLCRTRNCVNPAHLEVVTPEENNRRNMGGVTAARLAALEAENVLLRREVERLRNRSALSRAQEDQP